MRFPLEGGRWISFDRGMIECEFGFIRAWSPTEKSLEDHVLSWLVVCGSDGQVFRLERAIRANVFLELVRLGQPAQESRDLQPMLSGVRCWHDRRRYIPAVASAEDGSPLPVLYFAEGLAAELDLLKSPQGLVVRVRSVECGGAGGRRVPTVLVRTLWGPRIILWPSLLHDSLDPTMPLTPFRQVRGVGRSQNLVKVE